MSHSVPEMGGVWGGGRNPFSEGVPFVEFMYVVLTRMPGESYRRRVRSVFLCPLLLVCRLSSAINSLRLLNEVTDSVLQPSIRPFQCIHNYTRHCATSYLIGNAQSTMWVTVERSSMKITYTA